MKTETVNLAKAVELIINAGDKFFSVKFFKRGNGQLRHMNCRHNVTKHLTGGTLNYDPKKHNLISVYSMDAKGYRMIAVEGIREVVRNGVRYLVERQDCKDLDAVPIGC